MPSSFHHLIHGVLPNLAEEKYRITSSATWDYNCIAWALGITDVWWWPTPGRYWPDQVPREETIDAFLAALGTRGYSRCSNSEQEDGFEKIALFATGEVPTHAARQLPGGWWTSKLGPNCDIEHADLECLADGVYGNPVAFMSRQAPAG